MPNSLVRIDSYNDVTYVVNVGTLAQVSTWDIANECLNCDDCLQRQDVGLLEIGWHDKWGQHGWVAKWRKAMILDCWGKRVELLVSKCTIMGNMKIIEKQAGNVIIVELQIVLVLWLWIIKCDLCWDC